jgi:hypothetical protein
VIPGGCGYRENNQPCTGPPAYRTEFRDCTPCRNLGYLYCQGHRACTVHAAEARADLYLFAADGTDIVVERIRSMAVTP